MGIAAEARALELKMAQDIALDIARRNPGIAISINDVRLELPVGLDLGNASGSVFKGAEWIPAGFTQVKHSSGHARIVRTWRLK